MMKLNNYSILILIIGFVLTLLVSCRTNTNTHEEKDTSETETTSIELPPLIAPPPPEFKISKSEFDSLYGFITNKVDSILRLDSDDGIFKRKYIEESLSNCLSQSPFDRPVYDSLLVFYALFPESNRVHLMKLSNQNGFVKNPLVFEPISNCLDAIRVDLSEVVLEEVELRDLMIRSYIIIEDGQFIRSF